jgi:NAD(P)H dehydrogenase (quinone)
MSDPTPEASSTIAVTGATGQVGGRVARLLAAQGATQKLIVRDAARAPKLEGSTVIQVKGYEDREAMVAALTGVEVFLLIPGHETAARVEAHQVAIDAAVAAGVGRIVFLSFVGAGPDATFVFARQHGLTEDAVRASGLPHTLVRMNFYLDVLPEFVQSTGEILGPAGEGRVAAVARDDVAAALVEVLTCSGHDGKTYELTGREALTFSEAAVCMARASGRPISYRKETLEQARLSRAHYDATDFVKEGWITTYTAVAAGELSEISGDVRMLTGRDPVTLSEWLPTHPLALAHVDTLG